METGKKFVDPLALYRFGDAFKVQTEYVISGKLGGLPEHILKVVSAFEDQDRVETLAGMPPAGNPELREISSARKSAGRSTSGKAKRTTRAS